MMSISELTQRIKGLVTAPREELGRWGRFLRFQILLWETCASRLRRNNVMAMSSALSFRTIFALVPTLVLVLLALKPLWAPEQREGMLRGWIEQAGLNVLTYERTFTPKSDPNAPPRTVTFSVGQSLEHLVDRAEDQLTLGKLGPVGVVLLVWSALTLLSTVEGSLNRVFEAPKSRSWGRRIVLYWFAITLLPGLLVGAVVLLHQAAAAVETVPIVNWIVAVLGWITPMALGVLLLGGLYKLMPNTRIKLKSAMGGALVAVPLWTLARWGFGLYVRYVGQRSLLGALGIIPLFLLWLNMLWYIFLFGAELAHSATQASRGRWSGGGGSQLLGPWDMLAAAVAMALRHRSPHGSAATADLADELQLTEDSVQTLLVELRNRDLVAEVAGDEVEARRFILARSADSVAVAEVLGIGCPGADRTGRRCDARIARCVATARRHAEDGLANMTLAELLPPLDPNPERTES